MTETSPTLSRTQLRVVAESETASPAARLDAAEQLLAHFGLTSRNERILRRVAREFSKFVGDPRTQISVRERAGRLKARIKEAEATGPVQNLNEDEDADIHVSEDQDAARSIVGNTQLLPSDDENDPFWRELISNRSRREHFLMTWGLDPSLTRSDIDALVSDPAKIEAHTQSVKLWALTREQADAKFTRDSELIRAALAERRFEDSDTGREQLVSSITESGVPLVAIQPREHETIYEVGPVLVRTHDGVLLDALNFTQSWPSIRLRHQSL